MRFFITIALAASTTASVLPHYPKIITSSPGGPTTRLDARQADAPPPHIPNPVGSCTWDLEKKMQPCFPWPHAGGNGTVSSIAGVSSSTLASTVVSSAAETHACCTRKSTAASSTASAPEIPTVSRPAAPPAFLGASPTSAPASASPPAAPAVSPPRNPASEHISPSPAPTTAPTPTPPNQSPAPHDSNVSSIHISMPPMSNSTRPHQPITGPSPVGNCTWVPDRPMQTCFPWPQHVQANGTAKMHIPGSLSRDQGDGKASFSILPKETAGGWVVPRTLVTRVRRRYDEYKRIARGDGNGGVGRVQ